MKTGDKVVCVDDSPCRCGCGIKRLVVNNIYVVSDTKPFNSIQIFVNVIGVETVHGMGFSSLRFRLLDDLKKEAAQRNESQRNFA